VIVLADSGSIALAVDAMRARGERLPRQAGRPERVSKPCRTADPAQTPASRP
jgi:hypothetical protein